jgi:hypothetical protein
MKCLRSSVFSLAFVDYHIVAKEADLEPEAGPVEHLDQSHIRSVGHLLSLDSCAEPPTLAADLPGHRWRNLLLGAVQLQPSIGIPHSQARYL